MKVDFAWPLPLVSMVTHDRQVLSPSSSCPLKISLSLHPQTFKVILRCASAALADPCAALPSSLLSVCLPCQAEKPIYCMSAAEALSSPSSSIVCTPTTTLIHNTLSHIHTRWQKHVRWTGENLSRPTGTRCLNLLRLMFCVDLQW